MHIFTIAINSRNILVISMISNIKIAGIHYTAHLTSISNKIRTEIFMSLQKINIEYM